MCSDLSDSLSSRMSRRASRCILVAGVFVAPVILASPLVVARLFARPAFLVCCLPNPQFSGVVCRGSDVDSCTGICPVVTETPGPLYTDTVRIGIVADMHTSQFGRGCDRYPHSIGDLEHLAERWRDEEIDLGFVLGDVLELDPSDGCEDDSVPWERHAKPALDKLCELDGAVRVLAVSGNNDWRTIDELRTYASMFVKGDSRVGLDCDDEEELSATSPLEPYWLLEPEANGVAAIGLYMPDRRLYAENYGLLEASGFEGSAEKLPSWLAQKEWLEATLSSILGSNQPPRLLLVLMHQPVLWTNPFRLETRVEDWPKSSVLSAPLVERYYWEQMLPGLITMLGRGDKDITHGITTDVVVVAGHYHQGGIVRQVGWLDEHKDSSANVAGGLDYVLVPSLVQGVRGDPDVAMWAELEFDPGAESLHVSFLTFDALVFEDEIQLAPAYPVPTPTPAES